MTDSKKKPRKITQPFYFFLICLSIVILFKASASFSATTMDSQNIQAPDTPWHINAQKITYNQKSNTYTAFGNVQIENNGRTLSAETITFNRDTLQAEASDNVRLSVGKDTVTGDQIIINLETGIGTIFNGRIFIEKSHFYIQGDKILKTGENSYTISNASITTCDGNRPAWRVTGKEVDVTIEAYGTVRHAALWTRQLPVFYVPYLIFPVNIKRQSGLLPPQLGYSSRNGIEYIQPFFWAINQNSDATFYYHHLQNRGEKFGGEYRYALSDYSRGTLMMDSLDDRQVDDGVGDASREWGYPEDRYLRKNADRYWFRMKLDQKLPKNVNTKLDIDFVSDQDYLREFSSGYTGYDFTKKYFESEFGRDIDDENDPVRESTLNISKIWTQFSFNAELRWHDNVINRRQKATDDTLQQLPAITFDALKQSVFQNLVFMNMASGYTNFYRRDGLTGQRLDLHPRLYLPMHFENYFTFEPSAGFRQTFWYLDRTEEESVANDEYDYQHRELYDLKAELSTDLFNIYQTGTDSVEKIKHTLTPRFEYTYVPELNQEEYPDFDDTDRIIPENLLTFSLTNLFISKASPQKGRMNNFKSDSPDHPLSHDWALHNQYNQFLWVNIEQSYDFIKEDETGEKPFTPLYAELNLTPVHLLSLHAETRYDHDDGNFSTFNVYCLVKPGTRHHLKVDYRYTRSSSESVNIDFSSTITRSIGIFGNYERNIEDAEDIEKKIGCRYSAQCWALELFYKDKDDDQKIGFIINLKGLAEFGSEL